MSYKMTCLNKAGLPSNVVNTTDYDMAKRYAAQCTANGGTASIVDTRTAVIDLSIFDQLNKKQASQQSPASTVPWLLIGGGILVAYFLLKGKR